MKRQIELIARRLEVYARDVLGPAVYAGSHGLGVEAFQSVEPVTFEEAKGAAYVPAPIGWRWGPVWSTCWFRVRGTVPGELAGKPVVLRFSSGTEALLRGADGTPMQGLDANRDAAFVFGHSGEDAGPAPAAGTGVEFWIEAACNHPFGVSCFEWDPVDHHKRWKGPTPGELERAELAVFDLTAWRLHRAFQFGVELLKQLPAESIRARQLADDLLAAVRAVDDADVRGTAADALGVVREALDKCPGQSAAEMVAAGHAHIDTAWLWPLRETRRKCLRTFSNVLGLMDRFPEFTFLCSQAQQYAFVEEDSPALFERIKARVLEGRWEPGGGMWIEPDANCPSGESLLRQCLHADRYWSKHFGDRGRQRFLYLPDTFGFPGSLPGIMRHAGLDTFITNKLWWNTWNDFPHTTFRWAGVDGSVVAAHNTPGGDYNALLTPRELRRGMDRAERTTMGELSLQPFGYGDGGGGPTDWTIENGRLAGACEGVPRVRWGRVDEFCGVIHERLAEREELGHETPTWHGELYLEIHRGTLTTQARTKRNNRRGEELLRLAELVTFAPPPGAAGEAGKRAAAHAKLDRAWKKLLLNQFHDILPGSSIGWVYQDADADYAFVHRTARQIADKGLDAWAAHFDIRGLLRPLMVFNPGSAERGGVVSFEGADGPELKFVRGVPACGARVIDLHSSSACVPVTVERTGAGFILSNGVIEAMIDDHGCVISLGRVGSERDACGSARSEGGGEDDGVEITPINQLVMYEDRPHMWDAWDVDPGYDHKPVWFNDEPAAAFALVTQHPLRAEVRATHRLASGTVIEQTFRLEAGSPRLDVVTRVEWRETHRFLRALFPVAVSAQHATYDIQFGAIDRPTHRNTSWDGAKFENCAHRWMSVGEPGFGVALLNDGLYGHSCGIDDSGSGNVVMGLSLLRSPTHPDPDADRGEHVFTYALMPHDGDWRGAGVDREAEALNLPLLSRVLAPAAEVRDDVAAPGTWSPFAIECDAPAGVQVHALKAAEDDPSGGTLVLRLSECRGGRGECRVKWNIAVASVSAADALERTGEPHVDTDVEHSGGVTRLGLRPFEIVSLVVRRG